LENVPYRIARKYENNDCQLERISDLALLKKSQNELLEAIASGELQFQGQDHEVEKRKTNHCAPDIGGLELSEQHKVMRRYYYLKEIESKLGGYKKPEDVEEVVKRFSIKLDDRNPPSTSTVYRWWNKWVKTNKSLSALVDKKSGPKKSNIKEVVSEYIHDVLEEIYLQPLGNSLQDAYNTLRYRLKNLNAVRNSPVVIPSRSTFYRLAAKLDKHMVLSARKGKRIADKHYRSTGAGILPKNILERTEIDHTPIDLFVVDEDTGLPIGRPTLTFIIDCYSKMPLGFNVGFEGTSELTVMRTLRHAILSKGYIKKNYPNIENDWPTFGIPHVLVCDNGLEFHAHQLRRMCAELNIELIFCPKKEPWYKGAIERFLGTLNRQVSHRIEGTTFSSIKHRGEYDAVSNSRITLSELNEVIHLWLVDSYSQGRHKGISNKTPISMWTEGRKLIEPMLPESREQLDLILTHEYTRKLSHIGIQFKGLPYNSSDLTELRKFGIDEVTFRVDPENLGSVWIYDERNGDYIKTPCIYQDYAEKLMLRQHKKIRQMEKMKSKEVYDEARHLRGKEKLRKWIEQFSNNKKLRERKKTARFKTESIKQATPDAIMKKAWSSNLIKQIDTSWLDDDIDVLEIPDFEATYRSGDDA